MDASPSPSTPAQLALLGEPTAHVASRWRLDEATRARGRRGVASAREALAQAAARRAEERHAA